MGTVVFFLILVFPPQIKALVLSPKISQTLFITSTFTDFAEMASPFFRVCCIFEKRNFYSDIYLILINCLGQQIGYQMRIFGLKHSNNSNIENHSSNYFSSQKLKIYSSHLFFEIESSSANRARRFGAAPIVNALTMVLMFAWGCSDFVFLLKIDETN